MNPNWNAVDQLDSVPSPALLIDADRVSRNIQATLGVVGGSAERLRPHVKTHKMPAVVELQLDAGITRFKAATIAEAYMVANAGGKDVLLAYPIVGANLQRLISLVDDHPDTAFAALVDDESAAQALSDTFFSAGKQLRVLIDVDCGMHRTGIGWGDRLNKLRDWIDASEGLTFGGLHVYDGHLHQPSHDERRAAVASIRQTIGEYVDRFGAPEVVAGGSPTFALWAECEQVRCSPGTTVFWDVGYGGKFSDLPFEVAAALLTRVISKPGGDRVCLDLGYKSIAAEMPLDQRVTIPAIDDAHFVGQSEEHLVLESPASKSLEVGQSLIAFPRHICPTVALHEWGHVIRGSKITGERWHVTARSR